MLRSRFQLFSFASVAALVTTLTAIVGVYFGLQSLSESAKANQGNIILTLNRDFFFDARLLKVRQAIENNESILIQNSGKLTDQDLDDYLGMFEIMDDLKSRKIIDSDLLKNNFCFYIKGAYNNKEIKEYIIDIRKQNNNQDIYNGTEKLAKDFCINN